MLMLVKVVDGPEPNAACPIIVVTQEEARRGLLSPHDAGLGLGRAEMSVASMPDCRRQPDRNGLEKERCGA